jgi:hypothetical protein
MKIKFFYPRVTEVKDKLTGNHIRVRVSSYIFCRFWGLYDDQNWDGKVIFIFGRHTPKSLIETINHESVHWIIDKIENIDSSAMFDNLKEFGVGHS